MDSHERLNTRAIKQEWMRECDRSNSVFLVLLVVLSSFAVGLIPIAYVSTLENTKSSTPGTIVVGEAGVWSVFGEK